MDHRGELRLIVLRLAIVENDCGQRLRQTVNSGQRERGHFDDAAKSVALPAALHTEQADRVGLVEVEADFASHHFSQNAELRSVARDAEHNIASWFFRSGWRRFWDWRWGGRGLRCWSYNG